ncbi:phosphatase PAP2 family protein [SAR202 cluster bacterium AC-647-N09_OGT_505m]|nr:phosphatase PAP2 family protein [SAR202 cluster bacterium AC-647-N09_OGT_505m]
MRRPRGLTAQIFMEILLVVAAYYSYTIAKNLVHTDPSAEAFRNAWNIVSLERTLGIFHENSLQVWLMEDARSAVLFLNWVYTLGFWPLLGVTGVFFFVTDREAYYKYRTVLLVSFGIGVFIFTVYPLAPPRMMGELGFVDTLQLLGPTQHISRSEFFSYNMYAAMPSMHFAWALLISMAWASTSYLWAKVSAIVYQTLMAAAVVVTGNHYFVDVIVAIPVVMASFYAFQLVLAPSNHTPHEETPPG